MSDDGSVVLVGYTDGNWSTTNAGSSDCVAIKLDADGTLAWTWQVKSSINSCRPKVLPTLLEFKFTIGWTSLGLIEVGYRHMKIEDM